MITVKHVDQCTPDELEGFPEHYREKKPWLVIEDKIRSSSHPTQDGAQKAMNNLIRTNQLNSIVEEAMDNLEDKIRALGYTRKELEESVEEWL